MAHYDWDYHRQVETTRKLTVKNKLERKRADEFQAVRRTSISRFRDGEAPLTDHINVSCSGDHVAFISCFRNVADVEYFRVKFKEFHVDTEDRAVEIAARLDQVLKEEFGVV